MPMDSKTLTIVTVFAAMSIVLSLSPLKFSAPFAPFLKYQIWEIAIVTAFLLYGFKVGISISIINTLVLFVFYPGDLPTGPIYNFIAVISTLLGIYIIKQVLESRFNGRKEAIIVILSTTFGIIIRTVIMTIVNWIVLPYPPPFGYNIPPEGLESILSVIAVFNASIVLYTIPISYIIARAIGVSTKFQMWKS